MQSYKVKRTALLAVFLLMFTAPLQQSNSQVNLFIPADLEVISANNVNQIQQIATIGNGGLGQIHWIPDGRSLAISNNFGVWIHEAANLETQPHFIPEPRFDVLRFSADGSRLIVWNRDWENRSVHLWNVNTGQLLDEPEVQQALALNPEWNFRVEVDEVGGMASRHDKITFWNLTTGEEITSYEFRGSVFTLTSKDNQVVMASDFLETIVFEMSTGKPQIRLDNQNEQNEGSTLSPDGWLLLSMRREGPIIIRNARTGDNLMELDDSEGWRDVVQFTLDSRYVIAQNSEQMFRLWDVATGKVVYTVANQIVLPENYSWSWVQTVVGDQVFAVITPETGAMWFYDLASGALRTSVKSDEALRDYKFSPNGEQIAALGNKGTLQIWDTATGEQLDSITRYDDPGEVKAISPDNQFFITQTSDSLVLWDILTGKAINRFPYPNAYYTTVEFSPDGSSLAATGSGIYDLATGTLNPFDVEVWDLAYSPDGRLLALAYGSDQMGCCEDSTPVPVFQTIQLIDVDSGEVLAEIPEMFSRGGGFAAVAFSPDDKLLAADREGISIWNVDKLLEGEQIPLAILHPDDEVSDLAFSPDGTQLVASYALLRTGGDGFSNLHTPFVASAWDVDEVIDRANNGQTQIAADVNFSPYGLIVLAGARDIGYSHDGSMITAYGGGYSWPSTSGSPMTLYNPVIGNDYLYLLDQGSFVMSPDAKLLISRGDDARLHYWGIPKN